MGAGTRATRPVQTWKGVVIDALVAGLLLSGLGLVFNALYSDGIPLVADKEYDILVPCPEPLGEVFPLEPDGLSQEGTVVIDAREPEQFDEWHWAGASNVPFDFLDPVASDKVADIIRTRARRIAVYGDGEDPDSGRELARELAGRGARNVFFVPGGASALMAGKASAQPADSGDRGDRNGRTGNTGDNANRSGGAP